MNSQANLLTPWSNDPVSDPPSEMFYVRDEDSGEVWSPTPLPIREQSGEYVVRHGHGYTRFAYDAHGVALELLQFVPMDDPIKVSRLTLANHSPGARRLTVTAYLEWVLGTSRERRRRPFVITEMDPVTGAMFARNTWSRDFGAPGRLRRSRAARRRRGPGIARSSWAATAPPDRPAALDRRERLSGRTGAALDPCCALQTTVEIPAGGQAHRRLPPRPGRDAPTQARALVAAYRAGDLDARLQAVTDGWDARARRRSR